MCYAFNTYGASYFEIYVSDIDNLNYQTSFNNWTTSNCGNTTSNASTTNAQLSLYPNPSLNTITINGIDKLQKVNIRIFDEKANQLLKTEKTANIDISSLSNGVYFIQIEQNNHKNCLKFIKN